MSLRSALPRWAGWAQNSPLAYALRKDAMKTDIDVDAGRQTLHLVGQICLLVAGLTTLALVMLARYFDSPGGEDYAAAIGQFALFKATLDQAMLFGALVLVVLTCVTTWVIATYSSFRVAGPLYRLARNLERLVEQRRPMLLPLRAGDRLQQEAFELNLSQRSLVEHYARLDAALTQVESTHRLQTGEAELAEALAELRRSADRARY